MPVYRWKRSPRLAGAPDSLRPWLSDPGSLTARIVNRCRHFQVRVLSERRARPLLDEAPLIGLAPARGVWVREVLLLADGIPVVFAHSILSPRDLNRAWHMARAIGCKPLGAALFRDPRITRGPLLCARLSTKHILHRSIETVLNVSLPPLWARRSRFLRQGRPLIVTEVFLPGITRLS